MYQEFVPLLDADHVNPAGGMPHRNFQQFPCHGSGTGHVLSSGAPNLDIVGVSALVPDMDGPFGSIDLETLRFGRFGAKVGQEQDLDAVGIDGLPVFTKFP